MKKKVGEKSTGINTRKNYGKKVRKKIIGKRYGGKSTGKKSTGKSTGENPGMRRIYFRKKYGKPKNKPKKGRKIRLRMRAPFHPFGHFRQPYRSCTMTHFVLQNYYSKEKTVGKMTSQKKKRGGNDVTSGQGPVTSLPVDPPQI